MAMQKMEPTDKNAQNKTNPLLPQQARDARGSLEVFNPTSYATPNPNPTRPTNQVTRPTTTWSDWTQPPTATEPPPASSQQKVTSWMALKDPTPPQRSQSPPTRKTISSIIKDEKKVATGEVGAAEKRAAEWGLVLKTDDETGKPQGVQVRNSGGEEQNGKASRRNSGNSMRDSGDSSDDGGNIYLLRVSIFGHNFLSHLMHARGSVTKSL